MVFTDLQLHVLQWLQHFACPFLDHLLLGITYLGDQKFYLVLLSLLYWNVSPKCGYRVVLLFLVSVLLNGGLKELAHTTRPFLAYPDLIRIAPGAEVTAGGCAFPSGHAQGTTTVWGALWVMLRKPWLLVAAVAIIACVSLSRLYLGCHWPEDVIGGALIGVCFLFVTFRFWDRWEGILPHVPLGVRLGAAAVIPVGLFVVGEGIDDTPKLAGVLFGFSLAHVWSSHHVVDGGAPSAGIRVVGSLVGLAVQGGLYVGLGRYLPPSACLQFLLFAAIGAWVPFAAVLMRRCVRRTLSLPNGAAVAP